MGAKGEAATTSQELYSGELRCPMFPVSKCHYHGEQITRDAVPPAGSEVREVPPGYLPTASNPPPVEKHRYFSEPTVLLSENYHPQDPLADSLSSSRLTWRKRRTGSL